MMKRKIGREYFQGAHTYKFSRTHILNTFRGHQDIIQYSIGGVSEILLQKDSLINAVVSLSGETL